MSLLGVGDFSISRLEIRFAAESHSVTRNIVQQMSRMLYAKAVVLDWRRTHTRFTHGFPASAHVLNYRPTWPVCPTYISSTLWCRTNFNGIEFLVLLHQLKSAPDVLLAMGRVLLHDIVSCENGAHVGILIKRDR